MNFRIPAIDYDKVLKVVIVIAILTYLAVMLVKSDDFKNMGEKIGEVTKEIKALNLYKYLDNHEDYYYKIEGATYCISKQTLMESGEFEQSYIDSIETNYVEATYQEGMFEFEYKDYCVEQ